VDVIHPRPPVAAVREDQVHRDRADEARAGGDEESPPPPLRVELLDRHLGPLEERLAVLLDAGHVGRHEGAMPSCILRWTHIPSSDYGGRSLRTP
jgi:hypothetical protein